MEISKELQSFFSGQGGDKTQSLPTVSVSAPGGGGTCCRVRQLVPCVGEQDLHG